jgi:16S rRNA C967 or C1407 C5-methylase (RsmB/RsmF family)
MRDYLPRDHLPVVSEVDATKKRGFGLQVFDKVLCDVPCSSERHVLHKEAMFLEWKPRVNTTRQEKMLREALRVATRTVVYSTCSINTLENDGVVERVVKDIGGVTVERVELPWGEATEHGWQILPDTANGWGVLYMSKLVKEKIG